MALETSNQTQHFATLRGSPFAQAVWERKQMYERFTEQSGLLEVWRKMHFRFYGFDPMTGANDQSVSRAGKEGELHLLMMNHLRADVNLWLTLAMQQRSEVEPEATVDDYEAELEKKRAKATLAHYNNVADVESIERTALEYAGIYGAGFITRVWNRNLGELLAPPAEEDGPDAQPHRAGKMEAFATTPMDTFHDPMARKPDCDWWLVRIYKNRYDLAAEFPGAREAILNAKGDLDASGYTRSSEWVDLFNAARYGGERVKVLDEVALYLFFHKDTEAVPGGKFALMLDEKTVLLEESLSATYGDEMPIKRLAPDDIHRSAFGYSPAWGLLAPQEAQSSLATIALSNTRTFGLGVIITPKGSDVDQTDLGEGLKLVEYATGLEPPKALQLPTTPQEVYAFRSGLISEMGTLVGVNSVVRGDPEASLKSGSALALVQAQAVQFSQTFQARIVVWKEKHHFDTIRIAQLNMDTALEPQVAGDYTAALLKPFSGKDMKRIKRVKVPTINPMAKTLAGKVQMADTIVERFPNQTTPGDYFRVIETGQLDFLTRGERQRRANMDRENELLAAGIGPKPQPQLGPDGQPMPLPPAAPGTRYVRAMITDDHRAHIMKHLEVLDNPAIRESDDPSAQAVIDAVLGHVEEHEQLAIVASTQRLTLLELTNQPPLQSALPPAPPVPGESPDSAGEAKAPGGPGPGSGPSALAPPGGGEMPKMPQMPVNPSTGQRVEEMPGPV